MTTLSVRQTGTASKREQRPSTYLPWMLVRLIGLAILAEGMAERLPGGRAAGDRKLHRHEARLDPRRRVPDGREGRESGQLRKTASRTPWKSPERRGMTTR